MTHHTHLVPISDGWALWKWVRLRGAGFPAELVLELAVPEAGTLAEELVRHRAELELARSSLLDACVAELEQRSGDAKKPVAKALKRLRAGGTPDEPEDGSLLGEQVAAFRALEQAVSGRHDAFVAALDAGGAQASKVIRGLLGAGPFREAITWQNRQALHAGLDSLLAQPEGAKNKDARKRELTVATYLQRYAVKNDTIGFFGPVCWGRFAADSGPLQLSAGPRLVSKRTVYFEYWCISALAAKLAEDPQLRPWLAPRRAPSIRVEGSTLYYPIERSTELSPELARLLQACDGEKSAKQIAAALLQDPELDLAGEDEVFELLDDLTKKKMATWTLELPTQDLHPERSLRTLLERIADPLGTAALGKLDRLEHARDAVSAAAGTCAELDQALGALDTTFTDLTGRPGVRNAGQTYAGRTLVYEDCVRDVELEVGPEFVGRLGPPLALLLQSARWYTYSVASRYRALLTENFQALRADGRSEVDYVRFWDRVAPNFGDRGAETPAIVKEVSLELRRHWSELLLGADAGEKRVQRRSSELHDRVMELFRAPHPGWPAARHHSPDIMVAAAGPDAARRGEYLLVLGELHVAVNGLLTPMALIHQADPSELLRARDLDFPEPSISPVEATAQATRVDNFSLAARDVHVELASGKSWRPKAQVIGVNELVVAEVDGKLVVRTRDGRQSFDIINFFAPYLTYASFGHFALIAPAKHSPRVTIDDLVVRREQWQFTPQELDFAAVEGGADRFLAAQSWRHRFQLPRTVFVKVPEEPKPCYVDFWSPHYVELFAKLARKASAAVVTEMLPAIGEAWVTDAAGRAHTSELRINAVDPEAWRQP